MSTPPAAALFAMYGVIVIAAAVLIVCVLGVLSLTERLRTQQPVSRRGRVAPLTPSRLVRCVRGELSRRDFLAHVVPQDAPRHALTEALPVVVPGQRMSGDRTPARVLTQ